MAKVWFDGLETRSNYCIGGLAGTSNYLTPGRNAVGTYFQSGATALNNGTADHEMVYTFPNTTQNPAQLNEGYLRIAFYITGGYNATDANNTWLRFKDSSGNIVFEFLINSSGVLECYGGVSGSRAMMSASVSLSTWHVLQVYWKIHSSTGALTIKLDGSTIGTPITSGNTGANAATLNTMESNVRHIQSVTFGQLRIDDLTIHDTSGVDYASYPPDADIGVVTLSASGNYSNFLGSDGNSTNNYQLVDEIPFSGGDYVESSTLNHMDTYQKSSVTLASGRVITGAIIKGQARKTSATTATGLSPMTRLSSVDYVQSAAELIFPNTTSQHLIGEVMETAPDGSPWTQTNFNNTEIGAKKTT